MANNSKEMDYLLDCLAEECAEVAQVCMKAKRFGLDSTNLGKLQYTNREQIAREIIDVQAVIELISEFDLDVKDKLWEYDGDTHFEEKIERIRNYMKERFDGTRDAS